MTMEPFKKARLASLAVLLVVVAAGFLLGVAWDRTRVSTPPESAEEVRDDDDEDRDGRGRRSLIVEKVGLSAQQKEQVDSIVAVHRERMEALQEEVAPRYRSIIETTRESIKEVLTAEQRSEYDSLLAEHDRRRREHHDRDDDRKEPRQ